MEYAEIIFVVVWGWAMLSPIALGVAAFAEEV